MTLNIRDPIHGFIQLNDIEEQLIQTFPFQRLRFIHQLGTTSWVYPTGVHTRFDHSLGVLQLASRVIDRLRLLNLKIDDVDKKIFRIAALLHDIGHAPFSHVGEDMELFEKGMDHEKIGEKIIRESKIGEILSKNIKDDGVERVVFIITGTGKPHSSLDNLFYNLLAGQAGIDRMDYLLRDSHFLGVMYGKFDLERILETLRYDEQNDLYWEEGGIHALEQFLLARYFMFTEVYYHKTRRILDYHLAKLVKSYLKSKKEELSHLPTEVEEYLTLNDYEIISWMLNTENKYKDVFLNRKFFKKIEIESSDHPNPEEVILWKWLEKELKRKFDGNEVFVDKADKAPYRFEKEDIMVKANNRLIPIHEVSKLIESLRPIRKIRIYTYPDKKDKVTKFVKEFIKRERR